MNIDFEGIPSYCCMKNIWSSRALDSYMSFCLVYLTSDFQIRSCMLQNKPFPAVSNTGEEILDSIEKDFLKTDCTSMCSSRQR